ncbi:hypothetical protein [Streptomyces sp. NPDC056061]|uniref:hypothetical protein n=1 Tax=Streptomyces sp. NPDC056061 TaxID=3345700 RepID=UPI0035E20FD6
MTVRFTVREQITGVTGRPAAARVQGRHAAPQHLDTPSGVHMPDGVTTPCPVLEAA